MEETNHLTLSPERGELDPDLTDTTTRDAGLWLLLSASHRPSACSRSEHDPPNINETVSNSRNKTIVILEPPLSNLHQPDPSSQDPTHRDRSSLPENHRRALLEDCVASWVSRGVCLCAWPRARHPPSHPSACVVCVEEHLFLAHVVRRNR